MDKLRRVSLPGRISQNFIKFFVILHFPYSSHRHDVLSIKSYAITSSNLKKFMRSTASGAKQKQTGANTFVSRVVAGKSHDFA